MHADWLINNYHIIKKQFRSRSQLHNGSASHYVGNHSKEATKCCVLVMMKKLVRQVHKTSSTTGKRLWSFKGYIYWFVCVLLSQSILPDELNDYNCYYYQVYGTSTGHALHLNSRKNVKQLDVHRYLKVMEYRELKNTEGSLSYFQRCQTFLNFTE